MNDSSFLPAKGWGAIGNCALKIQGWGGKTSKRANGP